MDGDPQKAADAKAIIRRILDEGIVMPSSHFKQRAEENDLTIGDAMNVLQSGIVDEAEYENGTWRHCVRTHRIAVIVSLVSADELVLVTTWRFKR
jgi:hypothetical protein